MTHAQEVLRNPTNVSLRADLLAEARALGLNLGQTLEAALIAAIAPLRRDGNARPRC